MKPTNAEKKGCAPISSNCVIWQGPNIPCLGLCEGEAVSDVVAALGKKICAILDILDVENYDLTCLNLKGCDPKCFNDLIQLLINRICALEDIENPTTGGSTKGCPDCLVNIASCFYFNDPKTGDQVTTLQLTDYVTLIANTLCNLISSAATQSKIIQDHSRRIADLENEPAPTLTLPQITPVCVLPDCFPVNLDVLVVALERQFCELRSATGTPNDIFQAIAAICPNIDNLPALGTSGGTMGSLPGWRTEMTSLSDWANNMSIAYCDLRSAIVNIKANCCANPCNGVAVRLQAVMPTPNQITLFFTGTIPQGLVQCNQAGTLFKITDQSGNELDVTINLAGVINDPSGFPVQLAGTPINTADDLTISSTMCFKDDENHVLCQSVLSYTFVNTSICPIVTYSSGLTSIGFSFAANIAATYTVDLFDSSGTTLLQSQSYSVSNPTTVSGSFSGLDEATSYRVRVKIVTPSKTTTCPFVIVTTLPDPCPTPNLVTATITID